MKNYLIFIATYLISLSNIYAQDYCTTPNCATNTLNISTGYNHAANTLFADGAQDPYWILTDAPTSVVVNLNGPVNVIASGWGNPIANSKYVSAFATPGSNQSNVNPPAHPYSMERCFCTCGNNVVVKYSIIARADNRVVFYIDNNLLPNQPNNLTSQSTTLNFDQNDSNNKIEGSITLNAGRHCIRAELRNDDSGSQMGLDVYGTLTTTGNSLIKETCCNNGGFIVGYKYNDKNCNGLKDQGEPALQGWQVQLTGNNQSLSTTTDVNGYYSFAVPVGAYTVKEVMQNGWGATAPAGGIYSSVAVTANTITRLDFLNCDHPSTVCCPHLPNLIKNPDFNSKNPLGYTSAYTYDNGTIGVNSLMPGEQTIVTTADASKICSQWLMKAGCAGNFLLTNGATNQTTVSKLVWQQTVNNIKSGVDYKFCMKMIKLNNCCFSVNPRVDIKFSVPGNDILNQLVDDSNLPYSCDLWREITKTFTIPSGTNSVTIQIFLREDASGDGNDIGIDDIGFVELPKTPAGSTLFNMSHPSATGFMATVVDQNLQGCGVWWKVCECDDQNVCKPGTIVENPSQWWTYPTPLQFWGYNGTSTLSGSGPGVFDKSKRYRFELGVWCPCTSWNGSAYIWNPGKKAFENLDAPK